MIANWARSGAEVPRSSPKEETLRYLVLIVMASVMTGCASDVVLRNPRTGETVTCEASLKGLNPWSQHETCIGGYIERGWIRND